MAGLLAQLSEAEPQGDVDLIAFVMRENVRRQLTALAATHPALFDGCHIADLCASEPARRGIRAPYRDAQAISDALAGQDPLPETQVPGDSPTQELSVHRGGRRAQPPTSDRPLPKSLEELSGRARETLLPDADLLFDSTEAHPSERGSLTTRVVDRQILDLWMDDDQHAPLQHLDDWAATRELGLTAANFAACAPVLNLYSQVRIGEDCEVKLLPAPDR